MMMRFCVPLLPPLLLLVVVVIGAGPTVQSAPEPPPAVRSLAMGTEHTCAVLKAAQDATCWGANLFGQLGAEDIETRGDGPFEMGKNLTVVPLGTGEHVVQMCAAEAHSCALLADQRSIKCWGNNDAGHLGYGDTTQRGATTLQMGDFLPVVDLGSVDLLSDIVEQIACGGKHNCALFADGHIKCWGGNTHGQLGYGDGLTRGDELGELGNNLDAVDLGGSKTTLAVQICASPLAHTCAVLEDGSLKCFGRNADGELGLGDTADRGSAANQMGNDLPTVNLGTGRTVAQIACGAGSTCALLDDASVKCWGINSYGQLGKGDQVPRGDNVGEMGETLTSINVSGSLAANITSIAMGAEHVCANLDNHGAKCWGRGISGQLLAESNNNRGDGPNEMGDFLPLLSLGSGTSIDEIYAGGSSTCAVMNDTRVKCWGRNDNGQLGHGTTNNYGDELGETGGAMRITNPGAFSTLSPTGAPTQSPTANPSSAPTAAPSGAPSSVPSSVPSSAPTKRPTAVPSAAPSTPPSAAPSNSPSANPSTTPSTVPSTAPSTVPSTAPTTVPSTAPSTVPSTVPSTAPSTVPSTAPSVVPSTAPSVVPSTAPSTAPSTVPSMTPSTVPSSAPSQARSNQPSAAPSSMPNLNPSAAPSAAPSGAPSVPSTTPSTAPSTAPSAPPTPAPSSASAKAAPTDSIETVLAANPVSSIDVLSTGTSWVDLSWPAVSDPRMTVVGYRVAMQTAGTGTYSTVAETTAATVTLASLTPATEHRFKVAVMASRGVGGLSDVTGVTTTLNDSVAFLEDTGVAVRIVASTSLPGCAASSILDGAEDVLTFFGSASPSCRRLSPRSARLSLSAGAAMTPAVTSMVLWNGDSVTIAAPSNPTPATAALSSVSHISWCGSWTADAAGSMAAGGSVFPLSHNWSVSSADPANAGAVATVNAALALLSSATSRVTLDANEFAADTDVTVSVAISSATFGLADSADATTSISATTQPTVSIVGGSVQSVVGSQQSHLRATVSVPSCFTGVVGSASKVTWQAVQGSMPSTAVQQSAQRSLVLAALSLTPTQTYIFRATLSDIPGFPSLTPFADVTVTVQLSPPMVVLRGGTRRDAVCSDPVSVDASRSYDPNVCTAFSATGCSVLSYTWTCSQGCTTFDTVAAASITSSVLSVTPCDLMSDPAGSATMLLDVSVFSSASGQHSAEGVEVTVLPSATTGVTEVGVDSLPPRVNPGVPFFMHGDTDDLALYVRTAEGGSTVHSSTSGSSYFVVPADVLQSGVTYDVVLQDLSSGSSVSMHVELNDPPTVGTLQVSPAAAGGEAVTDSFALQSAGHVDDASDLPLSVRFSWRDDSGVEALLDAGSPLFTLNGVALPRGSSVAASIVVTDRLGSSASALQAPVGGDVVVSDAATWTDTVSDGSVDWSRPGAMLAALQSWRAGQSAYDAATADLVSSLLGHLSASSAVGNTVSSIQLHVLSLVASLAADADGSDVLSLSRSAFDGMDRDALRVADCARVISVCEARFGGADALSLLRHASESGCGSSVYDANQEEQSVGGSYVDLSDDGCESLMASYRFAPTADTDVSADNDDDDNDDSDSDDDGVCAGGVGLAIDAETIAEIVDGLDAATVEYVDVHVATLANTEAASFSSSTSSILSDVHSLELRPGSAPATWPCNAWEGASASTCTSEGWVTEVSDLSSGSVEVTISLDTRKTTESDLVCFFAQLSDDVEDDDDDDDDGDDDSSSDDALKWGTDGCRVASVTPDSVTCKCNHMTAFAVGTLVQDGSSQSQCEKLDGDWHSLYDHPAYALWLTVLLAAWVYVLGSDVQWFFDKKTKDLRRSFTTLVFISRTVLVCAALRIVYYVLMLTAFGTNKEGMACAEFGVDGSGSAVAPVALFMAHDVFYPVMFTLFVSCFLYWMDLADVLSTNMARAQTMLFLQESTHRRVVAFNVLLVVYTVAVDVILTVYADSGFVPHLARAHLISMACICLAEAALYVYGRFQLEKQSQDKSTMGKIQYMSKVLCTLFAVLGVLLLLLAASPVLSYPAGGLVLYSMLLPLVELAMVWFLARTMHMRMPSGRRKTDPVSGSRTGSSSVTTGRTHPEQVFRKLLRRVLQAGEEGPRLQRGRFTTANGGAAQAAICRKSQGTGHNQARRGSAPLSPHAANSLHAADAHRPAASASSPTEVELPNVHQQAQNRQGAATRQAETARRRSGATRGSSVVEAHPVSKLKDSEPADDAKDCEISITEVYSRPPELEVPARAPAQPPARWRSVVDHTREAIFHRGRAAQSLDEASVSATPSPRGETVEGSSPSTAPATPMNPMFFHHVSTARRRLIGSAEPSVGGDMDEVMWGGGSGSGRARGGSASAALQGNGGVQDNRRRRIVEVLGTAAEVTSPTHPPAHMRQPTVSKSVSKADPCE